MWPKFIIALFCLSGVAQATDVVNYSWYETHRQNIKYEKYYTDLLKLALEKSSDKYGAYELNRIDAGLSQTHMIELARTNKYVNIIWTMTSIEREEKLIPVRIPLFKGLGGCRISLIRVGEQARFDELTSAAELAKLNAGQGTLWPDTVILNNNDFQVSTAQEHSALYRMLAKGRFDYFPRALYEAFNEVDQYPELAIEQRFAIYYHSPFFYFVNKANPRLAERIQYGLEVAIQDGSFDAYFDSSEITARIIEKANLANREVIVLDNPLLSEQTKQALDKLAFNNSCIGQAQKTKRLVVDER
ncbi:transporter substrate-binding domain-containing protein [Thalassotalea sp. LPB0316]|uniref:transporter substrate-binding domain-containing protein n=1 Tax=Thalassotalea sp. LPB0316 TaxID=2769490 RepID=UPI00186709D3|nr:transporter substrate-binding domain-containing protein [Thalassotalea sp. LPB0316]QOL25243.1 transporter substrate-binding domain-containing protein [Thalassotalea sp. LPB0316]